MNWLGVVLMVALIGGAIWGVMTRDFPRLFILSIACMLSLAFSAFLVDVLVDTTRASIIVIIAFFFLQVVVLYVIGVLSLAHEGLGDLPEELDIYGGAISGAATVAILIVACVTIAVLWAGGMGPWAPDTAVNVILTVYDSVLGRAAVDFFDWLSSIWGLVIFLILGAGIAALAIKGRRETST